MVNDKMQISVIGNRIPDPMFFSLMNDTMDHWMHTASYDLACLVVGGLLFRFSVDAEVSA